MCTLENQISEGGGISGSPASCYEAFSPCCRSKILFGPSWINSNCSANVNSTISFLGSALNFPRVWGLRPATRPGLDRRIMKPKKDHVQPFGVTISFAKMQTCETREKPTTLPPPPHPVAWLVNYKSKHFPSSNVFTAPF